MRYVVCSWLISRRFPTLEISKVDSQKISISGPKRQTKSPANNTTKKPSGKAKPPSPKTYTELKSNKVSYTRFHELCEPPTNNIQSLEDILQF